MIVGIGVDVVDTARFERALSRTPGLKARLFAESELMNGDRERPLRSLAGRFAAKEALIKALGESTGITWHDMRIITDDHGNPALELSGGVKALADARGVVRTHVSLSHDAGIAVANVVLES